MCPTWEEKTLTRLLKCFQHHQVIKSSLVRVDDGPQVLPWRYFLAQETVLDIVFFFPVGVQTSNGDKMQGITLR